MFTTMSISRAPSRSARLASIALISGVVAPNGNPTTEHATTPDPFTASATRFAQTGFTHTEANPYSTASADIRSISAAVASGLSSVWSMNPARSVGTSAPTPLKDTLVAPAANTERTLFAEWTTQSPTQARQSSQA